MESISGCRELVLRFPVGILAQIPGGLPEAPWAVSATNTSCNLFSGYARILVTA